MSKLRIYLCIKSCIASQLLKVQSNKFRHVLSICFQSCAMTYSCIDISLTADIDNNL